MSTAADVYAVEMIEPRGRKRAMRFIATLAVNAATWGGGPANPGGRQIVITERATGRRLASWPERFGDDGNSLVDAVLADLESLDRDDFERRWIIEGPSTP